MKENTTFEWTKLNEVALWNWVSGANKIRRDVYFIPQKHALGIAGRGKFFW